MDGQKYVASLARQLKEGSERSDWVTFAWADLKKLQESTLDVVSDLHVGSNSIFEDTSQAKMYREMLLQLRNGSD